MRPNEKTQENAESRFCAVIFCNFRKRAEVYMLVPTKSAVAAYIVPIASKRRNLGRFGRLLRLPAGVNGVGDEIIYEEKDENNSHERDGRDRHADSESTLRI